MPLQRHGSVVALLPLPAAVAVEVRDGRAEGAVLLLVATALAAFQTRVALPSVAAPQTPRGEGPEAAPPFGVREVVPLVHAVRLHPSILLTLITTAPAAHNLPLA